MADPKNAFEKRKQNLLNLELFMRVYIGDDADEFGSVKVNDALLRASGLAENELWGHAYRNTRKELRTPSLAETLGLPEELADSVPFIVVNTVNAHDGGAALAFPDIFHDICLKKHVNQCYILPSSVEEVLALPVHDESAFDRQNSPGWWIA